MPPATTPLVREYLLFAVAYMAVGALGLGVAAARVPHGTRTWGPFLLMSGVMLVVLGMSNLGWLVRAVRDAPRAAPGVTVEPAAATRRRVAWEVGAVAALVLAASLSPTALAALLAGVAFGSGLVNGVGWWWLRRDAATRGAVAHRDVPSGMVAHGRRPVRLV